MLLMPLCEKQNQNKMAKVLRDNRNTDIVYKN